MTDHVKLARLRIADAPPSLVICADVAPLNAVGNYLIQAEGVALQSRYPVNRMAKVLFDRGRRGWLEVYGQSADGSRIILRFTCDIEKMAARQITETSERGIKFMPWTEKSVAALGVAAGRIPFAKDAIDHHRWPQIPPIRKRRSLGNGIRGAEHPGTDAAIGDQQEEAAVT